MTQYDPYWNKNSRNIQDRGGSEKAIRMAQNIPNMPHTASGSGRKDVTGSRYNYSWKLICNELM